MRVAVPWCRSRHPNPISRCIPRPQFRPSVATSIVRDGAVLPLREVRSSAARTVRARFRRPLKSILARPQGFPAFTETTRSGFRPRARRHSVRQHHLPGCAPKPAEPANLLKRTWPAPTRKDVTRGQHHPHGAMHAGKSLIPQFERRQRRRRNQWDTYIPLGLLSLASANKKGTRPRAALTLRALWLS